MENYTEAYLGRCSMSPLQDQKLHSVLIKPVSLRKKYRNANALSRHAFIQFTLVQTEDATLTYEVSKF